MSGAWNHNIHYHGPILSAVPRPCARGLDVGCGSGLLTRQLGSHCDHVTGIDQDAAIIADATNVASGLTNVSFVAGDVMTYPLTNGAVDFIGAVATLHHLPLEPALTRFRHLLAPGGVLAVVGLYRADGATDALYSAAGLAASWTIRRFVQPHDIRAPMQAPKETLREIRSAAQNILPGSVVKRRLLFRYSLVWRKPRSGG